MNEWRKEGRNEWTKNTSLVTWCAGPAGDRACVIVIGTSRTCLADWASSGTNAKKKKKIICLYKKKHMLMLWININNVILSPLTCCKTQMCRADNPAVLLEADRNPGRREDRLQVIHTGLPQDSKNTVEFLRTQKEKVHVSASTCKEHFKINITWKWTHRYQSKSQGRRPCRWRCWARSSWAL